LPFFVLAAFITISLINQKQGGFIMKRILFMMLIAVPGLGFLGCEELSNPTAVPLSDQGGAGSLAKENFNETRTFNVDPEEAQSPCEAQTIDFGGSLQARYSYKLVGSTYELTLHPRPQDVVAVGLSTGTQYKGIGTAPTQFIGQVGVQETFQSFFPMKSQGSNPGLEVQVAWQVTINPDGSLAAASADILAVECQ
jgi:hypothetical protein